MAEAGERPGEGQGARDAGQATGDHRHRVAEGGGDQAGLQVAEAGPRRSPLTASGRDGITTVYPAYPAAGCPQASAAAPPNAAQFAPGFLITHRFPLPDWQQAVAVLRHADGPRGKVLLTLG